jgi:hypothetical protein
MTVHLFRIDEVKNAGRSTSAPPPQKMVRLRTLIIIQARSKYNIYIYIYIYSTVSFYDGVTFSNNWF